MARIEVTTHIEADPARVWAVLTDWEQQPRWMIDVRRVTVLGPKREGLGVVLRARTRIAGVALNDDMVVTDWQEGRVVGVRHLGPVIRGLGAFELEPTSAGVHLSWWEEVDPPLGAAGDVAVQLLVAPPLRRLFRASLAGLKRLCETPGVPSGGR